MTELPFSHGLVVADAHITLALLDALIDKGILTRSDVRVLLEKALDDIGRSGNTVSNTEAASIVRRLLLKRFLD